MGQYYRPVILKKSWRKNDKPVAATLLCYDYRFEDGWGIGAKLMEHSYVGNALVEEMVGLLGTKFKGYPFVWVGDYADKKKVNGKNTDIYTAANRFIWKDIDGECEEKSSAYMNLWNTKHFYRNDFKYLVNYDRKEYCVIPKSDPENYVIHPLPLLTSSGNGRGGGDYGLSDKRVGRWAYNSIGATNDEKEIEGFKKISGFFKLDW